ncbi:MAG: TIGR01212 family radical SAM protein [Oscillospiraceae bacterium]
MVKNNPFIYSDDNKRYHTLYYHNKHTFGGRIWKAVIDGGFTCPNLDGTKGIGGCAFCDGGSGAFTKPLPIREQIALESERIAKKQSAFKMIAYFQVHTNTYAPIPELKQKFRTALCCPEIVGLSIGTRPDCLPDEVLNLLSELNEQTYLTIELGVQTIHDRTAENFNRGYSFSEFLESYHKLQERNIRTCLHIINGLPDESFSDMIETAKVLGSLCPQAMKIQLLHILGGTRYGELWKLGEISVMSQHDYIETVIRQMEVIPPETVLERVTGDGEKCKMLAPLWSMDKIRTLGGIDKMQADLDSWQGKFFSPKHD